MAINHTFIRIRKLHLKIAISDIPYCKAIIKLNVIQFIH